jgi:hypothetical protein
MAHHDSSHEIDGKRGLGRALVGGSLVLAFVAIAVLDRSLGAALSFTLSLAVFVAPGVPLAKRWFSGFEAALVGAALGYFLSSLLASILIRFELSSPFRTLLASAALFVCVLAACRLFPEGASREHPTDNGGSLSWLAATFVFSVLLVVVPFSKVGAPVPDGIAYRAYFSADLMTHLSVVAEMQKGTYPLANPFYAGDGLGYYWLFFAYPAAIGPWSTNQQALLSLYLVSGMLFTGLFFSAGRELGLRPSRAFLATAVAVGAVSYEGVFVLLRALVSGESFRDTNVDAVGRWVLGLVSLDGLHRSLLYTPQHLFSYSLLLVLLVLVIRGEPRSRATAILCGVLLGGMAGASIVTAMLAGPWLVLLLLVRSGSTRRFVALSFWTALPALGLLGWYVLLGFFGDAGGALALRAPTWAELPSVVLLDCGALVLLLLPALRGRFVRRDLEIAALAVLALSAVLFLDLRGYEGVWMAWRAGSVLLVALALLAAPALRGRLGALHAVVLLPAIATVALDLVNAQDVSNRSLSPGEFRWTTVVSTDEWEALQWLRSRTPSDAVVQWDVRARELGEWAFLPALAERRMAVGSPIFLLDLRKYRIRERRYVRPIFSSASAVEAHRLARSLGIDYLFLGRTELEARGEHLRKLFESKGLFRPVFANGGVTVLEVLRP